MAPSTTFLPSDSSWSPSVLESSPSSSCRRLWSRFQSLWTPSQVRALSDWYIRPDEPHRQYAPGDVVKGAVVLTAVKPIRVTHLLVELHGGVRVFKGAGDRSARNGRDWSMLRTNGKIVDDDDDDDHRDGAESVMRDEVVLCGQGRFEPGTYHFHFELAFPDRALPSSIDFERGLISYTIKSTLTRPTTVASTIRCERKLQLQETIDVAAIDLPKPQRITLALTLRGSKSKTVMERVPAPVWSQHVVSGNAHGTAPPAVIPSALVEEGDALEQAESMHDSEPSAFSGRSISSGSGRSAPGTPQIAFDVSSNANERSPTLTLLQKSATALVELSTAGCLPGDLLLVKITVDHFRPIRSMHGVIVTLYRQSRIDVNPWAMENNKSSKIPSKTDLYFPKSKTGLGALSLSAPGSVRKYRMDLGQTVSPLIVDPRTLRATIHTSVRVPDHVFPTIASVPRDIISFRYYVEVIIDLKGKLAGQDGLLAQLGMATSASDYSTLGPASTDALAYGGAPASTWIGCIIDTERLQREKTLTARTLEVVIGTKDSRRQKNRSQVPEHGTARPAAEHMLAVPGPGPTVYVDLENSPTGAGQRAVLGISSRHDGTIVTRSSTELFPPPPPPPIEEAMDEKTRLKQAEECLLPSRPPRAVNLSAASLPTVGPSTPTRQDETSTESASRTMAVNAQLPPPSAPTIEDLQSSTFSSPENRFGLTESVLMHPSSVKNEDKQELERRRLQAATSAPVNVDDVNDDEIERENLSDIGATPSAPFLGDEDDEANLGGAYKTSETLPAYRADQDRTTLSTSTPSL